MINADLLLGAVRSASSAAKMRRSLTKHVGDFVRHVADGDQRVARCARFAASIRAFCRFR